MLRLILTLSIIVLTYGKLAHFLESGRIVGGENTTIEEYPYQLSLEVLSQAGRQECGASLIKPNVALTAAHCVIGYDHRAFRVRAGSTFRESGGETARVLSTCIHPKFHRKFGDCDVALLKLDHDLPLGPNIKTINVQPKLEEVSNEAIGTVTGWGILGLGKKQPQKLNKVDIPKIRDDVCRNWYKGEFNENLICFGNIKAGKGTCLGDSGGPIVVDGKQVGVVSFGKACEKSPAVFAKLSSNDISNHIEKCLASL